MKTYIRLAAVLFLVLYGLQTTARSAGFEGSTLETHQRKATESLLVNNHNRESGRTVRAQTSQQAIDITDCILSTFYNPQDLEPLMYPDSNARYFFIAVPVLSDPGKQGAHFEIEADFPLVRYFSWTNYVNGGGGLLDVVMDNMLEAETGINPTQKGQGGFAELADSGEEQANIYRLQIKDVLPDKRSSPRPQNTIWGGYETDGTEVAINILGLRMYGLHPLQDNSRIPPDVDPVQWQDQGQVRLPRCIYVIDDAEQAPYRTKEEVCQAVLENTRYARIMHRFLNGLDRLHDRLAPRLEQSSRGGARAGANPPQWHIGGAPNMRKSILSSYPDTVLLSALQNWLPMYSRSLFLESNYYPNWNSGYLSAVLNPDFGEVYVFRVKIPSFPLTDQGEEIAYGSWDPESTPYEQDIHSYIGEEFHQVRYWSVCLYKPYLAAVSNCIRDIQLKVDPDGFVTVAVSSQEDRPLLDPVLGEEYNWLEWDTLIPTLAIREIYPHPGFEQGCFWYKTACESDPSYENRNCHYDSAAIKDVMGDFFPEGRYCSTEEFEKNRCGIGPW